MSDVIGRVGWKVDTHAEHRVVVPASADPEWLAAMASAIVASFSPISAVPDIPGERRAHHDVGASDPATGPEVDERELSRLAAETAIGLSEFAAGAVPARVVAFLGIGGRTAVPVLVQVAAHDDDEPADLLAVCGALGGAPVDAPRIEYPDVDGGDAVRVVRFDRDDEGVVWGSVSLARRDERTDTVVFWTGTDLELVVLLPDLIDEVLAALEIRAVEVPAAELGGPR